MLKSSETGFFRIHQPRTSSTDLQESMLMMREEGLANIFRRHERHARSVRAAVWEWGFGIVGSTLESTQIQSPQFSLRSHDQTNCEQRTRALRPVPAADGKACGQSVPRRASWHFNDLVWPGRWPGSKWACDGDYPHNGRCHGCLRCRAPTGKIPRLPPQPEDRSKLRARVEQSGSLRQFGFLFYSEHALTSPLHCLQLPRKAS